MVQVTPGVGRSHGCRTRDPAVGALRAGSPPRRRPDGKVASPTTPANPPAQDTAWSVRHQPETSPRRVSGLIARPDHRRRAPLRDRGPASPGPLPPEAPQPCGAPFPVTASFEAAAWATIFRLHPRGSS
ncbi:hypothetical protein B6E66_23510 [Streptomyces maremycinicus]|nr:hypothetical protein B6E66_23510 [Streptomyces sp. B9173]